MKIKYKIIVCLLLVGIILCLLPVLFSKNDESKQEAPNNNQSASINSVIENEDIILTFTQDTTVEYGQNISSNDFISSTNGEITDQTTIDTMKVGTQDLIYCVKANGDEVEFKHSIEIVDTQKPIIETNYEHIIFDYDEKLDFSLLDINVYDKVDGSIALANTLSLHSYILEHNIDTKVAGNYLLLIKAMDMNGLISEKEILIEVKEKIDNEQNNTQNEDKETDTSTNTNQDSDLNANQPTYINGILIVNKQYAVPRDFGGENAEANNALYELQNAAYLAGFDMPLLSGYRSYDYQKSLYENYVARDGEEAANRYSAKPGTSEHQTGLAFDVGEMSWTYGETAAGQWLVNHCAEFGFILRYLPNKEDITGYMYEPWHIRYVGVEHATAIMSQGITLEEYLGV